LFTFCLGKDGEKITEAEEEKMEVDETGTSSDQPVPPTNTDYGAPTGETLPGHSEPTEMLPDMSASTEETLQDDSEPTEKLHDESVRTEDALRDDNEPTEMLCDESAPTEDTLQDDSEPTEMLCDESAPTEETLRDDSEAMEDVLPDDSVLTEENSSDDNAPAEETSPDNSAPADETLPDDRTSPVETETEENSQAPDAEDNRSTSHQPSPAADNRLSPHLEAEVRIPSAVAGSESKCLHPQGDAEESVASPLCNENESSTEIKECGELCQGSDQAGDREIRLSPTSKTEAACAEDRPAIFPVTSEVPSLTEEKIAESTDASVVENVIPSLQEDAGLLLCEEKKGETEEVSTNAAE
jgi:hypothetical protein